MLKANNALTFISDVYCSEEEEVDEPIASNEVFPVQSCSSVSADVGKLPVPDSLKQLFEEPIDEEVNDSPELHAGRIRSFPHERGNWATCVFAPYKASHSLLKICDTFIQICAAVSPFCKCDDFHLSLSRTVVIRHHWIQPLIQEIRFKIKTLESFPIDFDDIGIYVNDEKTRTFIALKVSLGYDRLMNCVSLIDECFSEFKLPAYYDEPSFHLSLIWCVGDRKKELTNLIPILRKSYSSISDDDPQFQYVYISRICCKTGNRIANFELKS